MVRRRRKLRNRRGFTITEVVLAMTILLIGVLAFVRVRDVRAIAMTAGLTLMTLQSGRYVGFLAPLLGGPRLAAFALSEPDNGSDAGAMKTRAYSCIRRRHLVFTSAEYS